MTVRVRIAPSPTGNLHIGTARTAVFNWLFARNQGGTFILRVEDTDKERSRPEFTQNILEGLTWLGLDWDEGPIFQTDRFDLYRNAVQTLLDKGLAYRSYETPEELAAMREAQKAAKQAPRYDNRHRNLTPEQRAAYEAEGRTAVIRFKIDDDRAITWNDLVRGELSWKGSDLGGDMVVARAAAPGEVGQPLYNLAVVVDDIDMQITHVIRGEDHIANTAKQILLYEALGADVPQFAHTPLILNQRGQKLSKRDGATSVSEFEKMGYLPEAMANYMALLGWSPPDGQERFTLEAAKQQFSFDRVNKAGAKFDWDKLNWLNGQLLHEMSPEALLEKLIPYWQNAGYEFDPEIDRPWLLQLTATIGPSLAVLPEAVEMVRALMVESVEFTDDAAKQVQQDGVADLLQAVADKIDETLDEAAAKEIVGAVTKEKGVKKGMVMKSLRAGLMGSLKGPDLIQSWLILHQRGWDKARLQGAIALATG
ncbi:MAG TPA: glutamate--tRNA ligase [Oscillatoriales cyanobacterium M59_W2019_021]|nr:MAG: glutamate--tRNA ligase [Cyanobacteria bacterium J055]HIK30965.1 glutamate--tRNA ligase [Oscillatoriales cyanobacterium M4454_W2019_049]HIK50865.1 glutamate--tRNA ligase [Oscillatoriales cyanobacterium M59_W2019_021]